MPTYACIACGTSSPTTPCPTCGKSLTPSGPMFQRRDKTAVPPAAITPADVLAALQKPFDDYRDACRRDDVCGDVRFWELQVWTKGEGKFGRTVVLIPETHSATQSAVYTKAAGLADAILGLRPIPAIAVEEPVKTAKGALIPNAGAHPMLHPRVISGSLPSLFADNAEPDTQGSVAYQLYVKQVEQGAGGVRFAAEPGETQFAVKPRRLEPQVNVRMADSLTVFGPLVVYPVGAYHMIDEDRLNNIPKSIGQILTNKGYTRVRARRV
jgi:hypothetical protein